MQHATHTLLVRPHAQAVRMHASVARNSPESTGEQLVHTSPAGQPFRLAQVRQALQTLMQHPGFDKVWITTPGGIAEYAAKLPAACVP